MSIITGCRIFFNVNWIGVYFIWRNAIIAYRRAFIIWLVSGQTALICSNRFGSISELVEVADRTIGVYSVLIVGCNTLLIVEFVVVFSFFPKLYCVLSKLILF
jgi:hypothetical protein